MDAMAIKVQVRMDKGRQIAKLLWPDLTFNAEGNFWDRYGQDAALGKLTVQIKYDSRIATSGNLYHEIYEKSALNDGQRWRKSPGVADSYIFCTETATDYIAWFVLIDALAKAEEGRKLTAIFPNDGAKTSMGFIIPISALTVVKRFQRK